MAPAGNSKTFHVSRGGRGVALGACYSNFCTYKPLSCREGISSRCSSVIRATHAICEGCGFDSRLRHTADFFSTLISSFPYNENALLSKFGYTKLGKEEEEIIIPALKEMSARGILCYGPYPADGFMGSGNFTHFDGVLAMYHDQGLAPFKALAMDEGVNYTAGLPVIRTSPAHGTAYDIAGKGLASEDSFRQAIYVAIDVFRNRLRDKAAHANPLRKQYYEKRDDSDKLKLDSVEEDL